MWSFAEELHPCRRKEVGQSVSGKEKEHFHLRGVTSICEISYALTGPPEPRVLRGSPCAFSAYKDKSVSSQSLFCSARPLLRLLFFLTDSSRQLSLNDKVRSPSFSLPLMLFFTSRRGNSNFLLLVVTNARTERYFDCLERGGIKNCLCLWTTTWMHQKHEGAGRRVLFHTRAE